MTNLNFSLGLDNDCDLSITNTSTGFVPETVTNVPFDSHKLSDGYFIDIITYDRYNCSPVIALTSGFNRLSSAPEPNNYRLVQDSTYTVYTMFVISDTFYEENKNSARFAGKTIYVTDGIDAYLVSGDVKTRLTLGQLILADLVNSTVLTASQTFIATCHLNKCYQALMLSLLEEGCLTCNDNNEKIKHRDLLHMTLEVIQYLKDLGNITEIQRVIESLDLCGGFCKSIVSKSNCGCNG